MSDNRTFRIEKDYYATGSPMFLKGSITFKPGFTVLVGCNGSGKTTILHHLKDKLTKNKIPFVAFDNKYDGGSNAISVASFYGNFEFVAESMLSSEGEEIMLNIGTTASKIGTMVRNCAKNNKKELWVLLDGIDSGLSIDNIVDVKKLLIKTILDDCQKKNIKVFIITSANEFELAKGEMQFDVIGCRYVKLKDYDEYADFIIESAQKKNKRSTTPFRS